MLIDLLDGDVPPLHRMALFAICAHLPLVNIGVTIRALRAHVGKHHLGVALRAGHALVQTAQRILCGVVIELRNRADRLPAA